MIVATDPPLAPAGAASMTARRLSRGALLGAVLVACLTIASPAVAGQAPSVNGESVSAVTATEATVSALVNPGGLVTTYQADYGTTPSYGLTSRQTDAGAGTAEVSVQAHLSGLTPSTVYHVRVAASNAEGSTDGSDVAFTTPASTGPTSSALPDGRRYEAVSLGVTGDGEVYHPSTGREIGSRQPSTSYPVRAAADGEAVAYAAEADETSGGGSVGTGGGDIYIARRNDGRWALSDMTPAVENSRELYQGYSADLSLAFLNAFNEPLAPEAPAKCGVLYMQTSDGQFHPEFTSSALQESCAERYTFPLFAGVSADNSSTIFEAVARLTPQAPASSEGRMNLYDSTEGQLSLVNVLPDGTPEGNAAFGGVTQPGEASEPEGFPPGYRHFGGAISSDGSKVIWTDLNTNALYVRMNPSKADATTVLVADNARYEGASADGSEVFYTKEGDLYEFDLSSQTARDLTPGGDVVGVVGNSETGSHVYFVAQSVLASNGNPHGERPEPGAPNFYVTDEHGTRFIAALSPYDDMFWGTQSVDSGQYVYGDWRGGLSARTAEVAPDGRHVVFMSHQSLTGYDNAGDCLMSLPEGRPFEVGCPEVFIYSLEPETLFCASCNPSGEPPIAAIGTEETRQKLGGAFLMSPGIGATAPIPSTSYQLRTMSADGGRVFFDSAEPLLPGLKPGVERVYEWERTGVGTCHEADGCIYLLSGAASDEEAVFLDADETGDNVFFTTRAQLVAEDKNEKVDVYDARVDGGASTISQGCSGTGCQGVPPASPSFATPASVTFAGTGDYPHESPSVKARLRSGSSQTKCRSGFVRRGHKCARVHPRKRKTRHRSSRAGATRKGSHR